MAEFKLPGNFSEKKTLESMKNFQFHPKSEEICVAAILQELIQIQKMKSEEIEMVKLNMKSSCKRFEKKPVKKRFRLAQKSEELEKKSSSDLFDEIWNEDQN